MALRIFTEEPERLQKRWILAAAAIALFLHAGVAGVFDLCKIPRLQTPAQHSDILGPFTVKQVEINPKDLQTDRPDPTQHLPAPQAPKNPAEFNLDPNLVEKALQTPQPMLRAPTLPAPAHVVAASDLSQGAPYVASDNAAMSAEISKVEPVAPSSDPVASTSQMAQDLINSSAGALQPGQVSGAVSSNGQGAGTIPGFGELPPAPPPTPDLNRLPEPVLVRLPADVLFDFDSAQLKPDAANLLGQAAGMIAKYPDASIQVDGYSDSFGDQDYNVQLSTQRAQAVQDWLQAHAPPGTYRFRAQGHGSTDYVVSPTLSIAGQQPNRRVELVIQALKPQ
jgi:outer membrane protein OmpA-like peptidoglycan-associated protein